MADITDNSSSKAAAGKKPDTKDGRSSKPVLRWIKRRLSSFKRPKSANASAGQPNSTRISISSASGAGNSGAGNDAESADPTASGSNLTSHQDPLASFEPARLASLTVPDRSGSAMDQGHGSAASHASTPTLQPASANPPTQMPGWKANAKEGLGVASRFTQTILKKVPECVDGNPVKMAFAIARAIIDMKDAVGDNQDEIARLKGAANILLAVENTVVSNVPKTAKDAMEEFKEALEEEMGKLQSLSEKPMTIQILDYEDSRKMVQEIFKRVEVATKAFQNKMAVSIQNTATGIQATTTDIQNMATGIQATTNRIQNVATLIQNTTMSIEQKAALERLRPSYKADHKTVLEEKTLKREECTAGTRVKILEDITKWANDSSPESASVFWLTGQAGSGKTTIAYTIAKSFEKSDQQTILGGNFLCSRQFEETRQRTRIIPTIAYQLARKCKPYADALHAADKFDAVNHDIATQLKDLFLGPWQQSEAAQDEELPRYLIVIDALDEIEADGGSGFLRNLLTAINEYELRGFKFLVTSRPDPEIVTLCGSFASEAIVRLQDVPIEEAESDIGRYLEDKLPKLAGSPELIQLGQRAGGLFIYAATVVKHLTGPRSIKTTEQKKILTEILRVPDSGESAPASKATFLIDQLYRRIMQDTFSEYEGDVLSDRLRILHTFLCTAERTSTSVVAALVGEGDDEAVVRAVAEDLHAVLYIQNDLVFWYHASFPDFIFNPARSNFDVDGAKFEFCCNTPALHNLLGESCFRIMCGPSGLRFNMGDIESSFLFDSDNADVLSEKVNTNIGAVLRYSCRHWTYHLPSPQSVDTKNILACISDFLKIRVLFWIEGMNLLGSSNQCTPMLQRARQWVLKCGDSYLKLASDVGEAANFATYFTGNPTVKSTPHLYISALATWGRDTSLYRNWKGQFARIPVVTHTKGSIDVPLMTIPTRRAIPTVAFSSDGTRIVSGSHDNSVRVWDASTGAQLKELSGHTSWVNSVAFSSDGTRIVSGSGDNSVRVWDASTGAQLKELSGHTSSVYSVAFSSDGTRIVSGSDDNSVRVWDVSTGAQLKELSGHTSWVNSVAFSSDGTRIVSGSRGNSVRVWDVSTGAQLKELNGHTSSVNSVAFSSDGTRIVSSSDDHSVRVWDASTGAQLKELSGHTSSVYSVAFSSDGARIVSGSPDNSVRVWDVSTGAQLKELSGHTSVVFSVAFSSDGTRIVSGSGDNSVRVWDASTSAQLKELSGHTRAVNSVAFSSDGRQIVSSSDDNLVQVWDASTGAQLKELSGHTSSVNSVAFSSDGTRIVSGSHDNSVRVWDVSTGAQLKELSGHTSSVNSVAFSSDGTRIVSGSDDNSVRVWDASTGAQLKELSGYTSAVYSVAFSSDGTRIVSSSHDNSVRVWDVSTGAQLKDLSGHTSWVYSVAFSSDGTRIVSGSHDNSVRVWDVSTGAQLKELSGHTSAVFSVAFSSDGTRIVSGSGDNSVRLWDASTGLEFKVLNGHTSVVASVSFSSNGTRIVSGSPDNSVRVWIVDAYTELKKRKRHTNSHNPAGLLPDDYFAWHLMETNWIISSQGQKHLLWIPPQAQVARPSDLIISRHGSASVDFQQSPLGAEWVGCYTPNSKVL